MNKIRLMSCPKSPFKHLKLGEIGVFYPHGSNSQYAAVAIRTEDFKGSWNGQLTTAYGVNLGSGCFVFDGDLMVTKVDDPTITVE